MSFHAAYPLTVGYTLVDKNLLSTVRLHDSWSDVIVVSIAPSPLGTPWPITIIEARVEFDNFAKTVIRAPGSGQPGDCKAWTEGSVDILSKEMKILDPDNDSTKVISGVTYPIIFAPGGMTFSGQYTKVLFPCDKVEYLDDNTTDANIVEAHPYADEEGTKSLYIEKLPSSYDHLTEFRPDPTHDVTLTYHIHVVYQGGFFPGDPANGIAPITIPSGYEIHTITQKVLNNPDDNVPIINYLLRKEIGVTAQQEKYGWGEEDPKYKAYSLYEE